MSRPSGVPRCAHCPEACGLSGEPAGSGTRPCIQAPSDIASRHRGIAVHTGRGVSRSGRVRAVSITAVSQATAWPCAAGAVPRATRVNERPQRRSRPTRRCARPAEALSQPAPIRASAPCTSLPPAAWGPRGPAVPPPSDGLHRPRRTLSRRHRPCHPSPPSCVLLTPRRMVVPLVCCCAQRSSGPVSGCRGRAADLEPDRASVRAGAGR